LSLINKIKVSVFDWLGSIYRTQSESLLKHKLTVFCYHDVTTHPSEFSKNYKLNIPPEIFENQIDLIKKNFNIINPDQLLSSSLPNNPALITFDDGYASTFQTAIPILTKRSIPCLIFLNMGPIKGEISAQGLTHFLCEKRDDFLLHLSSRVSISSKIPPFLYCSKKIVNSYIENTSESFDQKVGHYVGPLAKEIDLENMSKNHLVYFGNHLYHHDVPLHMDDHELVESYNKNKSCLDHLPNYRDFFAFPFGQPKISFTNRQIEVLKNNGAKKIFSSAGKLNHYLSKISYDRLSLSEHDDNERKIWAVLLKSHLRSLMSSN